MQVVEVPHPLALREVLTPEQRRDVEGRTEKSIRCSGSPAGPLGLSQWKSAVSNEGCDSVTGTFASTTSTDGHLSWSEIESTADHFRRYARLDAVAHRRLCDWSCRKISGPAPYSQLPDGASLVVDLPGARQPLELDIPGTQFVAGP